MEDFPVLIGHKPRDSTSACVTRFSTAILNDIHKAQAMTQVTSAVSPGTRFQPEPDRDPLLLQPGKMCRK
jgi:hypothetical protein